MLADSDRTNRGLKLFVHKPKTCYPEITQMKILSLSSVPQTLFCITVKVNAEVLYYMILVSCEEIKH